MGGFGNVNWPKVGEVTTGIIVSIVVSGLASFMVMRVFRGAIRDKAKDRDTVLLHGPWIAGAIFTWLSWFMVFKGLKNVEAVKLVQVEVFQEYGITLVLLAMWGTFTLATHLVLVFTHRTGYKHLFSVTAVLGMICMAFAFGQNDLANAASPGLASFTLWQGCSEMGDLANIKSKIPISAWALFGCGVLMASGMLTNYAQRVTRAQVNTGSQFDSVSLYAPEWCKALARFFIRFRKNETEIAPPSSLSENNKKIHFDTLRASVITGVSASVIAFASGQGLPVSTTYVAFAAILGSGFSDRVFTRGEADTKLGRAIWVVSCWVIAPIIAILATGIVANVIYRLSIAGIVICIFLNLGVRYIFKRRSDAHEKKYHHA